VTGDGLPDGRGAAWGNLVGVSVTGDGTDSGSIDPGGGMLGSKGKNDFSGLTRTGGNYAIALTGTDATNTVFARGNQITASDPTTVVLVHAHKRGDGDHQAVVTRSARSGRGGGSRAGRVEAEFDQWPVGARRTGEGGAAELSMAYGGRVFSLWHP
jgi:hypothetical protein